MEGVYELHQHTHCVLMHIGKKEISMHIFFTSNRKFRLHQSPVYIPSLISYNKQRTEVTYVGKGCKEKDKDDVVIDNFRDGLYNLFKKDRGTWDEEDKFLIKAVSDYFPLAIKETLEEMELEVKSFDLFHYVLVIPSEWEEEVREDIIRPIFVQSGLVSNQDHQDRLVFFTDIESLCYTRPFERGDNTTLCRITPEEEEIIIKFDLIQTATTVFNLPNANLFPKVINSNSVSVTFGEVEGYMKDFLIEKLFPVATADNDSVRKLLDSKSVSSDKDQIIEAIIEGINLWNFPTVCNENEEYGLVKEPWITFKEEWMLSKSQKNFINSLCRSTICAEIGTFLLDYMKDISQNEFAKSSNFLLFEDDYSNRGYGPKNDTSWLRYILKYNCESLNYPVNQAKEETTIKFILSGAGLGIFDAIQYSDMYCNPRIVSSVDLTTSSSVFLHSKPDVIINLDISLGSTLLTCSILEEDGLIQQIFDHDYFIRDKHLPPLGHFFTFPNMKTLNIKEQFIPFAERYLLGDLSDIIADDGVSIKECLLLDMKAILTSNLCNGDALVSTERQKYIKAFILMYMIYIKEEILYKLPDQLISDQMDTKIGYAISVEAILLNNTMENKDNLRDIIYASGLVPKDDHSKKLRITAQGEGILSAIQKSLKLESSLKSYFLLCQLYEDYVQLSLHQVVTTPSSAEKEQESIIVQDEIMHIQNIYDSMCLNMWHNLLQDNSLIELCEIHHASDNNKTIDLFLSKIKTEFFANLKRHISDNILQNDAGIQSTHTLRLTSSCNCKVSLATSDIIDVSFTPVLQDIACALSASLLNRNIFGAYMNIDYLFSLIRFNNNPQLQYEFARILEEEANEFNLESGINTSCLVVPKLFGQLLQPVIMQRPFYYKDFKIGALQQVCSENYAFRIYATVDEDIGYIYKSKITDTETIECGLEIAFPFLNKGDVINNVRTNRRFYLRNKDDSSYLGVFKSDIFKFETMNYLENGTALSFNDNVYHRVGGYRIYFHPAFETENVDVPVVISVRYVSYTSSLKFSVKTVGADMSDNDLAYELSIGEPLTLTRF